MADPRCERCDAKCPDGIRMVDNKTGESLCSKCYLGKE